MQRGRSFLLLALVALGLGGYIYVYEYGQDLSDVATDTVFDLEPGSIEEIEVVAETGETTRLTRADGEWRLVEPLETAADTAAAGGLATSLETLALENTLDETPASVAAYGLEPARYSVAFRVEGETGMRRIAVGNTTPTGGELYARVDGQPALLLIAAFVGDSLNKTTFDLRDKSVLDLSRDVDRVTLRSTETPDVVAARENNEWALNEPVEAKADFAAIDGAISRILQAEMQSVVTEDGTSDLGRFGLDAPRLTAVLGSGSAEATLVIGADADEGGVYARDMSRPMVFTLEATLLDELTLETDDVRAKDVFLFRSFNAVGADMTLAGTRLALEKREVPAEEEGASPTDEWVRTAPADGDDLDQARVTDLLSRLSNLRAESFAQTPVTGGEELAVSVRFGNETDPSEETVTFRKRDDVVHALVPGEPGAAVIPTASYDAVLEIIRGLAGIQ